MIELHQFAPAWGINPSPFCLKVEVYMRLAGLPFRPVTALPTGAPKRKLPFIVDQGRRIPDSAQIIAYLQATYGDPLDRGLSPEQRALGHLMRRTCEESLYFVFLYGRWIDAAGWAVTRTALFGGLPPIARDLVPRLVRRKVSRDLSGQGYGRHSRDEIYALAIADLEALALQLDRHPFALADRATTIDACLYAFLVNITRPPIDTPAKQRVLALPALAGYIARLEAILPAPAVPDRI